MKGQLHSFAADPEGVGAAERHLWGRPGRIVVSQEEASCVLVTNPDEIVTEKISSTGVIRMVMGVHEMRDGVVDTFGLGDFVHRPAKIVADRRRGVEENDPLIGGKECRLVGPVSDPEQVPLDAPDVVVQVIEGWSERGRGNGYVVGK